METIKQRLLSALAQTYERSGAGKTGVAARPVTIIYRTLLAAAGCHEDSALRVAEQELRGLHHREILSLRFVHRDETVIEKVELHLSQEEAFYRELGSPSPTRKRETLHDLFLRAVDLDVPVEHRTGWQSMCSQMAREALTGASVQPFERGDYDATAKLLRAAARLLGWKTESLLRFTSCQVFKNSKTLEQMRPSIESVISIVTNGQIDCLSKLGILENPRQCYISGPAILHFPEGAIDLRLLRAPLMLSKIDLERCTQIETPARQFCTIENHTTFHELAKIGGDTLLACTDGYAGSALLSLMNRLPEISKFHFGDSDPAGFDILADLRARSGLEIESIHMCFRPGEEKEPLSVKDSAIANRLLKSPHLSNSEMAHVRRIVDCEDKGVFEQEMLGIPASREWPFYTI